MQDKLHSILYYDLLVDILAALELKTIGDYKFIRLDNGIKEQCE